MDGCARGRLRRLLPGLAAAVATVAFAPHALAGTGSFGSSDPLTDRIWAASVRTAEEMLSPPVDLDPLGCPTPDETLILDGLVRDRCPYIGDIAVTGQTLLVAGDDPGAVRSMILLFADLQHSDGAIPASPLQGGSTVLVDYPAYWIETLYDYTLATGDLGTLRQVWPNLLAVLDRWYPTLLHGGLVVSPYPHADYAAIRRHGDTVAYFNAEYARALRLAAMLADWIGESGEAGAWRSRAGQIGPAFTAAFWDASAGAFRDTTEDSTTHPEDGNAFAILAGLASPAQARSALAYLDAHEWRGYGNAIADSNTWDDPSWGYGASERVYPFMSYYEVLARFQTGEDGSAVDLIRREWGYMLGNGPGTMWETIGPYGGGPAGRNGSWAHGWSTGAAPALTEYVLGVQPTSPGYATFTVTPHPGGLGSAHGVVPTPHGPLTVSWKLVDGTPEISVQAPPGTTWTNPPAATGSRAAGRIPSP